MIYIEKFHNMDFQILYQFEKNKDKIFYYLDNAIITYRDSLYAIYNYIEWLASKKILNRQLILQLDNSVSSQLFFLAALHTNDIVLLSPGHTNYVTEYLKKNGFSDILTTSMIPELNFKKCNHFQKSILRFGNCSMLSSGATGLPKIVRLNYEQLVQYGQGLNYFFKINESDRLYNVVPFYHGFGLTRVFTVIFSDSSQVVPKKMKIENIFIDINKNLCTWASFIPRIIRILNNCPEKFWHGYRFSTSSASMIDVDGQKKFENFSDKPLFVEYGCTEAGIISSNNFDSQVYGSLGKSSMPVKIENGTLWACPNWHKNGGWIDTGDIVEIKDKNLWLLGRQKEIIKKNGKTIFPLEIESSILKIPGVEEAAIYARDAMTDQESIGLIYTGKISMKEIKEQCNIHLEPMLRPDHIFHCESIPYHNNKLRRQELQNYVDSFQ